MVSTTESMILITGGCGYIGSHIALELLNQGYEVLIVDNLSNSSSTVVQKLYRLSGILPTLYVADLRDIASIQAIFASQPITAVIHCAGVKSVAESVANPAKYHSNNVIGSSNLLSVMQQYQVDKLIFSSSATVYAQTAPVPFQESAPLRPNNPYGDTKLSTERLIGTMQQHTALSAIILRYFNPVGAHHSGLLGENPTDSPNNLFPCLAKIAQQELPSLTIFGNDYATSDGTCVRDYVHVVDVATAHVAAVQYLLQQPKQCLIANIGNARGYSVLEALTMFAKMSTRMIPYQFGSRRTGDMAVSIAATDTIRHILQWHPKHSLAQMCQDHWQSFLASCSLE
jgi:UDP-glucose 4-epimerase